MRTLVVGIGSTIRGDDGLGVHAARQLKRCDALPDVDMIELGIGGPPGAVAGSRFPLGLPIWNGIRRSQR